MPYLPAVLLLAFYLPLASWSLVSGIGRENAGIYSENGFLENAQAGLLMLVLGLFAFKAASLYRGHKKGTRFDGAEGDPLVGCCYAYLSLGFFLREVDPERMNLPRLLQTLGSGTGRDILMTALFGGLAFWGLRQWDLYRKLVPSFLRSRLGTFTFVSFGLLLVASLFDQMSLVAYATLVEELLELAAYSFLGAAAISFAIAGGRPPPVTQDHASLRFLYAGEAPAVRSSIFAQARHSGLHDKQVMNHRRLGSRMPESSHARPGANSQPPQPF